MKYYNLVNNKIELTTEGIWALDKLNLNTEQLKDIAIDQLNKLLSTEIEYGCRIPYQNEDDIGDKLRFTKSVRPTDRTFGKGGEYGDKGMFDPGRPIGVEIDGSRGRFPANLLVSDDILNDGRITKGDKRTEKKAGNIATGSNGVYGVYGNNGIPNTPNYNDSGSYSRYFDLDKWAEKTLPFLIVPKASKSEKDKGLEDTEGQKVNDSRTIPPDNAFQRGQTVRKNTHPTVKPIKLMAYLITMGSRPGDIVLDPFCGSGTTCIATKILNRQYVGIDLEQEHVDIANLRIGAWNSEDLKIVFKDEIKNEPKIVKTIEPEIKQTVQPITKTNKSGSGLEQFFT